MKLPTIVAEATRKQTRYFLNEKKLNTLAPAWEPQIHEGFLEFINLKGFMKEFTQKAHSIVAEGYEFYSQHHFPSCHQISHNFVMIYDGF